MAKKHSSIKNTRLAFILNLLFTLVEFIGGFLTNSMAILSDAVHDLGDSLSLGSAWYLQKLSKKGRNEKYSFGYSRFSTLGALISGVVLIVGSIFVLTEAVPRLLNPQETNAQGMFWFAILGVAMNGFAAWRLHQGDSMNEKVLTWHLLEDVLGWIGILIISIIMFFQDIPILDPLLSIIITSFVLFNVIRNLIKTINVFLNAVPENIDLKDIQKKIERLDGIAEISHLHIWSIDGEENIMTTHVYVNENTSLKNGEDIKRNIRRLLKDSNIVHSTIEIHEKKEEQLSN